MSLIAEVESRLARITAMDTSFRAFCGLDRDGAMDAAARGPEGPLSGQMFAVKDNIAVTGQPWCAGTAAWRNDLAEADATVVANLRNAGALMLGRLNMAEAALGGTTDNPYYGRCANPLDVDATAGGSSGGSAAAISAGFVEFSLGTDTLGSVRLPAAYCGVAGFKPTDGLIDRAGLRMLAPSLDTIGPLARRVSTLTPVLEVMAGGAERVANAGPASLGACKIGWVPSLPGATLDDAIRAGFLRALDICRERAAALDPVDMDGWNPEAARRAGLVRVEAEAAALWPQLLDEGAEISETLRGMLIYGRDKAPGKLDDANAEIARAADAVHRALSEVDMLLIPTAPQRAFRHDSPAPDNQAEFTALANFAGLPALAIPVPLGGGVLPASIQLIGRAGEDRAVLAVGEELDQALLRAIWV